MRRGSRNGLRLNCFLTTPDSRALIRAGTRKEPNPVGQVRLRCVSMCPDVGGYLRRRRQRSKAAAPVPMRMTLAGSGTAAV